MTRKNESVGDIAERLKLVGANLRRLRHTTGQSQTETAIAVNISRPYLSEAEGGANISMSVLIRLARHFGVTAASIVEPADSRKEETVDDMGLEILQAALVPMPGAIVDCNCPGFEENKCMNLMRLGDCNDPNYTQKRA